MVATREIEQSAQQFRGNNKYGEKIIQSKNQFYVDTAFTFLFLPVWS